MSPRLLIRGVSVPLGYLRPQKTLMPTVIFHTTETLILPVLETPCPNSFALGLYFAKFLGDS